MAESKFATPIDFLFRYKVVIGLSVALVLFFCVVCIIIAFLALRSRRGNPHLYPPVDITSTQPGFNPPGNDLEAQLVELLRNKRKIEAIKLYRQHTGTNLLEAKNFVEELESRIWS